MNMNLQINSIHESDARGEFSATGRMFGQQPYVAIKTSGYDAVRQTSAYATLTADDARAFGEALIASADAADALAPVRLTVEVPRDNVEDVQRVLRINGAKIVD